MFNLNKNVFMDLKNLTLKSLKLSNGKVVVSFDGDEAKGSVTYIPKPHPDLVEAIDNLSETLKDVYKSEAVEATGISLSGSGEGESIVVTGKMQFASGRVVGISSEPFQKEGFYGFETELWDRKDKAIEEAREFLMGKVADTQTKMVIEDKSDPEEPEKEDEEKDEVANTPEPSAEGVAPDPDSPEESGSDDTIGPGDIDAMSRDTLLSFVEENELSIGSVDLLTDDNIKSIIKDELFPEEKPEPPKEEKKEKKDKPKKEEKQKKATVPF